MRKWISAICLAVCLACFAQQDQPQTVQALFEYPVAPEELTEIGDKSDYLMQHFWDQMDFRLSPVNQTALNHAFSVWATPMRFADKNVTLASVDAVIEKLKKNPTLLMQFMRAAEYNIYGPNASVWIDDVYLKFLNAVSKNKKIKADRKSRYESQLAQLRESAIGSPFPKLSLTDANSQRGAIDPGMKTIVIVADPANPDASMGRLALELSKSLETAVEEGRAQVAFVAIGDDANWKKLTEKLPLGWKRFHSNDAPQHLDLRAVPSLFILDEKGTITAKNVNAATAITLATE